MSCELLNCDVPKLLDFFTLTESERKDKDRKASSVDSDLGISDSINSNSENNSWFEKRDDLYIQKELKTEEKTEQTNETRNDDCLEKIGLPAVNDEVDENKKAAELIDDELNACEVINVDSKQQNENVIAKEADYVKEKNEGLFVL